MEIWRVNSKNEETVAGKVNFVANKTTVGELRVDYAKAKGMNENRIELRERDVDGKKFKKLEDDKIAHGDIKVFAKDLGPQVGYRVVFTVEYFGPLVILLLFFMQPLLIFPYHQGEIPNPNESPNAFFRNSAISWSVYNDTAKLGFVCWMAHFFKRELESFFVHKFSRKWMPIQNIFKNCTYYYSFAAVIGYYLCRPSFTGPTENSFIPSRFNSMFNAEMQVKVGLAIFIVSEIGNLICHIMLSNLRTKEGSKERPIPKGFLFELVACPNYTFEVFAWVGFSIMTNLCMSWIFAFVGLYQMAAWANDKHKGYIKDHGDAYKKLGRKRIIPFIY